jgi:hypothetical protein
VLPGRGLQLVADILLHRIVGGHIGGEDRHKDNDQKDDTAHNRPAVAQELFHYTPELTLGLGYF